jgi:site-specific DNA-adenine methylase
MIDKIECENRYGNDLHTELIELLKHAQRNTGDIPDKILEEEYNAVRDKKAEYPSWYVGLVGFCSSFGAKYFGGYDRDSKDDNSGKWSAGAIRNLKSQANKIQDVVFTNENYLDIDKNRLHNYMIYCDPPYKGTLKYKTSEFNYESFWDWVVSVSQDNYVLVSEYNAPDGFVPIWEKDCKTLIDSNKSKDDIGNIRTEKLFTYSNGLYANQYINQKTA